MSGWVVSMPSFLLGFMGPSLSPSPLSQPQEEKSNSATLFLALRGASQHLPIYPQPRTGKDSTNWQEATVRSLTTCMISREKI